MELYVGLDASLKETSICVVDGSGGIVSEGTVNSEPAAIAEFFKAKAGNAVRIGLETGPTTTWLWHELRALGFPVICIDARHAKAALSLQVNKSDRCPRRDGGVGEIDRGFARPHRGKRDSHIDPPTSSDAIMQRAQAPTAERTVNPAGASRESLTSNPRVREHPGSQAVIER